MRGATFSPPDPGCRKPGCGCARRHFFATRPRVPQPGVRLCAVPLFSPPDPGCRDPGCGRTRGATFSPPDPGCRDPGCGCARCHFFATRPRVPRPGVGFAFAVRIQSALLTQGERRDIRVTLRCERSTKPRRKNEAARSLPRSIDNHMKECLAKHVRIRTCAHVGECATNRAQTPARTRQNAARTAKTRAKTGATAEDGKRANAPLRRHEM